MLSINQIVEMLTFFGCQSRLNVLRLARNTRLIHISKLSTRLSPTTSTTTQSCLFSLAANLKTHETLSSEPISRIAIDEDPSGQVIRVYRQPVKEEPKNRVFIKKSQGCALCTCDIPVKISYQDVLILEQFMRVDGTVLPKELTGLCRKQQLRVERCVMQAHWCGLFPDRTHPKLDRAGYKRFERHWDDDFDMYRLRLRNEPGSWYYKKRYNSKKGEFSNPLTTTK